MGSKTEDGEQDLEPMCRLLWTTSTVAVSFLLNLVLFVAPARRQTNIYHVFLAYTLSACVCGTADGLNKKHGFRF
jgi:hypothetical protein